jgi:hypothetical protein
VARRLVPRFERGRRTRKEIAVIDRNQVHEGMVVRSSDGRKLGRVLACDEGRFVVERGFFFSTDYVARYEDVMEVSDAGIRLSRPEEALPHGEHAFAREGGLGESVTVGLATGLDTSPREPWAVAEDEEETLRRGRVRGDEVERGATYNLGEDPGTLPPGHGDRSGDQDS